LQTQSAGIDFRGTIQALKDEYREGDLIITRAPFALDIYMAVTGDYFLQEITASLVNYDPIRGGAYYRGKWVGNALLRNRQELEDVLLRHHRVWLLAMPF